MWIIKAILYTHIKEYIISSYLEEYINYAGFDWIEISTKKQYDRVLGG